MIRRRLVGRRPIMTTQHCTAIAAVVLLLAYSASVSADTPESGAQLLHGERHLKGTVEQIKGGQAQLNTGEVEPRFIPLKAAKEKGFAEIKVGDVIELTVNDQNLLVDYHPLDERGQPVGGHGQHQVLRGQIAQPLVIGHDRALIRTEDGKETSFQIRTQ